MKVRLFGYNIVPHQVMRVRQVITAFEEIHPALLILDGFKIVVGEHFYRDTYGERPVDGRLTVNFYLFQCPFVLYRF